MSKTIVIFAILCSTTLRKDEKQQSFRDLNKLFGKRTISQSQCREWFACFKSGDTSLENKPGRGRLSDFDDQALLAAMEEDKSLTTQMLASMSINPRLFIASKSLEKCGKLLDGSSMSSPTTTEPITFEFSPSYCSKTSKYHFLRILSLGMSHGFSSKM
ncbi:UNVERIFIED_CONTAM: hypothetical protein NCL1_14216 [Trichonephila clavipes]